MKHIYLPAWILLTAFLVTRCSQESRKSGIPQNQVSFHEVYYAPLPPPATLTVPSAMALVSKTPNAADAYYQLGMAYYKNRQYSKSINNLQKSILLSPMKVNVDTYFYIAFSYDALQEPEKALLLFQLLASKDLSAKDLSRVYLCLGIRYQDQGYIDKAKEYYTKSIEKNPTQGSSFLGLGYIAALEGNQNQAMQFFLDAVRYADTDHSEAKSHAAMGKLFEEQNIFEEATHQYKRALELDGSNEWAKEGMERMKNLR